MDRDKWIEININYLIEPMHSYTMGSKLTDRIKLLINKRRRLRTSYQKTKNKDV